MRLAILAALLLAACPGPSPGPDAGEPGPDAGAPGVDAAAPGSDASEPGPDAGPPPLTESEPNDLATATDYDDVALPFEMTGTLESKSTPDVDVLFASLQAGDLWTWRLQGPSGKLSPDLYLLEKANAVPYLLSFAPPGQVAEQEQFVLASGPWYAVVADRRNPSDSTTACAGATCWGGPDFDWRLTVERTSRTPKAVTFPSTVSGTLRHPRAIDLYGFHASSTFRFDIDLKAERKSPASDVESQMSLFDATNKKWVITNNGSGTTNDAHVGGDALPATADYVLVVENLNQAAVDLSYELSFTLRQ